MIPQNIAGGNLGRDEKNARSIDLTLLFTTDEILFEPYSDNMKVALPLKLPSSLLMSWIPPDS